MREPAWTIGAVEALRQCETASYVCYVCRKVTSGLLAQTDKPLSHSSPRRTFDDRSSFNNVSLRSSTSWITRWQLPTQIHGWLPNLGDTSPRRLGAEVERRLGVPEARISVVALDAEVANKAVDSTKALLWCGVCEIQCHGLDTFLCQASPESDCC